MTVTKGYEVLYIIKSTVSGEALEALKEKVKAAITKNNGDIIATDDLGKRELSTTFKNHSTGIYQLVQFNGDKKTTASLTHHFSITENIIRHLTVELSSVTPLTNATPSNV